VLSIRCLEPGGSLELPGAPPVSELLTRLEARGVTRREWCYVLERGGAAIGRVALRRERTCPAQFLGQLPEWELFPACLWLPWQEPDVCSLGELLISSALERAQLTEPLQVVLQQRDGGPSWLEQRLQLCAALGLELFQEKQSYGWREGERPPTGGDRLRLQTLEQAGVERFRDTLGRCGEATLDRNDRWYRQLGGSFNWASVYLTLRTATPRGDWLLARDASGAEVGVVCVSHFAAPDTGSIDFIGVVPEQRGQGYVGDLLRAANAAALRAGFSAMLSDTDVLNLPMRAAFPRNGHRPDAWSWHKWHFRQPARAQPKRQ
jgi:RimJ/RimL family protein N-acetyltransferase